MALTDQIEDLAGRVAEEFNTVRSEKADDTDVVKLSGDQTVGGQKTVPAGTANQWIFNQPPQVAQGSFDYHPVRRDDPRLTDARTPLPHEHSGAEITSGLISPLRFPRIFYGFSDDNEVTSTGSQNISAELSQSAFGVEYVLTGGNLTLNVPIGTPLNRQVIQLEAHAVNADRQFIFHPDYRLSTGISSRTINIPDGELMAAAIRYSSRRSAWFVVAATVSES